MDDILSLIAEKKLAKILRVFLDNPSHEFYLLEIAAKSDVSPATTLRITRRLVKDNILKEVRISRFKLYVLNKDSPIMRLRA